jgi:hypothetical protein
MSAFYSSVLASDTSLLFTLFSEHPSYLAFNLHSNESTIVCADISMTPILIKENDIYWKRRGDESDYELVKTKIK